MTLKLNGYSTAQFGKCHEIPVWQTSPMGPFDQWPTGGGGFEYFYGFLGGETNQWDPGIYEGTTPIEPPKTAVTLHSNAGKCALGSRYCTQFPEFAELFVFKSRTESDARKKDSVIFVLISRTDFSRNFVRVLCATVRDFSAVKMQSNPGKGLKTNKRDSGN
jgi:hypothetical protein